MSAEKLSVNQQLQQIVQPNRCISKMGVNMSQQFVALKKKQAGDISVLNFHKATQKRMQESNKLKEDTLVKEGKLKVINSDLKRAQQRNSVKDTVTMETHMAEHAKRIRKEHMTLQQADPKSAAKIKLERISPVQNVLSAFKSPSRNQLQEYEARESVAKPNANTYRPRFNYVLNQAARPKALTEDRENPGIAMKRELFEKKQLHLCQRLVNKIDRGHELEEIKQLHEQSFVDNHPRGFMRRGSNDPYFGQNSSSLLRRGNSPSMKNLSRKNLVRSKNPSVKTRTAVNTVGHTAQPTGRESNEQIQIVTEEVGANSIERTVENFTFKRDLKSVANRTGDGQISLSVSRMNSIKYDDPIEESYHGPPEELKIGKQRTNEDQLRNTQPKSMLPAVVGAQISQIQMTDYAQPNPDEKDFHYTNQSPVKNSKGINFGRPGKRANNLIRNKSKPEKHSNYQPIMMSKIDSQLSIQQQNVGPQKDLTRSVSVLHSTEKNRPLPIKQRNNSQVTADLQKRATNQTINGGSSASLIDLTQSSMTSLNYKSSKAAKLGYDVAFQTNKYHLVRNKNFYGNEDSIQLLPNHVPKLPTKLPSVKMNLQIDRPPNLAQLHDARFEDSNKDPKCLSSNKKVKLVDFNKQTKQERHECLINVAGDVSMQKYNVNDTVLKKRSVGGVDMSKQKSWDELIPDNTQTPALESHDALKAAKQLVHSTSVHKSGKGGVGLISLDKQEPRQFKHFQVAELSEKQQRQIELAQDEEYIKTQKQLRQKAVMNIHSRLGEKYASVPRLRGREARHSQSSSRLQQIQALQQDMRQ